MGLVTARTAVLVAAVAALLVLGGSADALAAKPGPLRYLRAGGCPVQYLSEKTGTYTAEEQALALRRRLRVHEQVMKMRPPIDWRQNPYRSRAFEARLADFSFLDALFYVYATSRDYRRKDKKRALEIARTLVLDWVRAERRDRVSAETWTDRVAARRAIFLSFLARAAACERMLTQGEARKLRSSVREHARWLRDPAIYKPSNHGLSVDLGLAALGRYFPRDPGLREGGKLGRARWQQTFFASLEESEGVWLEHSPGYFAYAISLAEDYLRVVNATDPAVLAARAGMKNALAWLTAWDRRMAQFGDTNLKRPPDDVRDRSRAQRGLWVAPASGYAVVKRRRPKGWLAIASSYHSGVHKHADELSFELYDHRQRVITDTGQFHKDRDRYYDFQRSPFAHSGLVADGVQFDPEDTVPYGSGIEAWGEGDGWFAVWARNPVLRKQQGVSHERLFLYRPGYALLIADRVGADASHSYTRYFQIGSQIAAQPHGSVLGLSGPDLHGALSSSSSVGEGALELVRGRDDPLGGWHFPRFRERVPRTTASWTTAGAAVDHLTTLALDSPHLRASLAGPIGREMTVLLSDARGASLGALQITREGSAITVEAQGSP